MRWFWSAMFLAALAAGCTSDRVAVTIDGAIDAGCPDGLTLCDGVCVDLDSDQRHCGTCGHACDEGQGQMCTGGNCHGGGPCAGGVTFPQKLCGGECPNVLSDNNNCGDCGIVCDTDKGFSCIAGSCACADPDLTDCNGECVNLNADSRNCGECRCECGDGAVCVASHCASSCQEPYFVCSIPGCVPACAGNPNCGVCIDPTSDNNNCGDCDVVCDTDAGFVCINGSCECVGGLTDCGGTCVNTLQDPNNCGDCDQPCLVGPFDCQNEICQGGSCVATCTVPLCPCDGSCVDLFTNSNHCGGCNNACSFGEICVEGECQSLVVPDAGPSDGATDQLP